MTFHNYLLGEEIGTVFIDNLSLQPGDNNVFDMRATIDKLGSVIGALGKKPYCDADKGVLPLVIRGRTVVNHGQPLPYFADALAAHNQTIPIDIATPLKDALKGNFELKCSGK